ncbi:EAL domain-containing protein [Mesorhizobium sp. M2D.F.Ca.ET.185.01.1.1]|nr:MULTISPECIES: EAL domain-containing protein [unclassified Mesorhizobium]TGP77084.1 EAL domain-containing protein [bacterium M00.F.Ca.ET.227.01.1.1]TGP84049.1 EAL domain-containing protein [bacterium M00.F.Ca.ET.221.01.1.1]TGP88600.1 EAL domain-containing protein [bacterium M00.F.Ca.ET.222.01.1.1]TGQ84498.1 EAL domain-containing protein [Mesorhizobium sp. M2D.F.Ca.ET.206.01.1.1]TGU03122.1 EAL domain-containing protein [bacterium M00.F.Ca.ET.163.01.1.1]TGU30831.1 EAL domain-containing protei
MNAFWRMTGFALIVVTGAATLAALHIRSQRDFALAKERYLENSQAASRATAKTVEDALHAIYENVRTLTYLPSVQNLDRHGTNLGEEGRATIQQIYNNLANNVSISEVYFLPLDFDPDRFDPVTGKLEEPILQFDQLIVNARARIDATSAKKLATLDDQSLTRPPEEVETYEYHELARQLAWLKANYPTSSNIEGLNVPIIGTKELITCDNTDFIHSGNDADRSGFILSVPVFAADGSLRGSVSAIMLTSALRKLLPSADYVIVNADYGFESDQHRLSTSLAADTSSFTAPDPNLIYSEVIPLSLNDPRSAWRLWAGFPNSRFENDVDVQSVREFELASYAATAIVTLLALVCWYAIGRTMSMQTEAAETLERRVDERTAEIQHLATHDILTGLPNRGLLADTMDEALRSLRDAEKLAVHCIDLDRFKPVNDTLGHPVGDELLRAVAARLKQQAGETAMVARVGGDEFIILQLLFDGDDQAGALASRVIHALSSEFPIQGHTINIGGSIGIAVFPDDGQSSEILIRNADLALYKAKMEGRGTCRSFEPGMDARLQERRLLEAELALAVAKDQFVLHYQPLHDAETSKLTGFEALVRWNHPRLGQLPPSEFIHLSEEIGVIDTLGEWILRKACADAAQWPLPVKVAVNLSPAQFKQQGLPLQVASALAASNLLPSRLELEITESVLLADNEHTIQTLHSLRDLGVSIAMDDFGTGYSSLSYLRSFPFNRIKIDRSFVSLMCESSESRAIVKAVADLGSTLGMTTTAEGVETEDQYRLVKENGCTDVQGWLFGRPMPASELTALFEAPRALTA